MSDLDPDELAEAQAQEAASDATDPVEPDPNVLRADKFAIRKQPGVTVLNGEEQTPFTMTNRHTGEVVSYGRKVAEREMPDVQMCLTCDEENGVFWILIVDNTCGEMFQNGFLADNAEVAFQIFIGGTDAQIRAELMIDPPASC